jgi:hypothetical protein
MSPAIRRGHEDGAACDVRLVPLESRGTALPNRARSVVGEHPGGLNDTGTDASSVLTAELAGSAPLAVSHAPQVPSLEDTPHGAPPQQGRGLEPRSAC